MSFRELRSFTEALRALGYPRAISISSFQTPNFKLVADILYWLAAEVLDCVDIPLDIDTADNRISFLHAVHEAILSRTGVSLSAKQLYKADGHAIREMNKAVLLLYRAALTVQPVSSTTNASVGAHLALSSQLDRLKKSKAMAAAVAQSGEQLASLLSSGVDARLSSALSVPEPALASLASSQLSDIQAQVQALSTSLSSLTRSTTAAREKLTARREDADRDERRLDAMGQLRAAFSDEYLALEDSAQQLHQGYVARFRVLQDLEQRVSKLDRQAAVEKARSGHELQQLQQRKGVRDRRVLLGDEGDEQSGEEIDSDDETVQPSKPLRAARKTQELGAGLGGTFAQVSRPAGSRPQRSLLDDEGSEGSDGEDLAGLGVRGRQVGDSYDDEDDVDGPLGGAGDWGAFRDLDDYEGGMGAAMGSMLGDDDDDDGDDF